MAGPVRIAIELDRGRARLTRLDHGEFLAARLLGTDGPRAKVALLASCATLLAGDHVDLQIDVGAGVDLELVEPAGTVAYNARGGAPASWTATITVADAAAVRWHSAPFVVADGAYVARTVDLRLAGSARVLTRDLLMLGRTRELGGAIRSRCHTTIDGEPLLVEDLDLTDPVLRAMPGLLGDHRAIATAMLLGVASPAPTPAPTSDSRPDRTELREAELFETELAGPGALARALGRHAHAVDAALDQPWRRWCGSTSGTRSSG